MTIDTVRCLVGKDKIVFHDRKHKNIPNTQEDVDNHINDNADDECKKERWKKIKIIMARKNERTHTSMCAFMVKFE